MYTNMQSKQSVSNESAMSTGLTMSMKNVNLPTVPFIIPKPPVTTTQIFPPANTTSECSSNSKSQYTPSFYTVPSTSTVLPPPLTLSTTCESSRPRYVLPPDISSPSQYSQLPSAPNYSNVVTTTVDSTEQFSGVPSESTSTSTSYRPVSPCWFYASNVNGIRVWWPFSRFDSCQLENAASRLQSSSESSNLEGETERIIPVEGGRYDVSLSNRERYAVYWDEPVSEVRRATWFYRPPNENRVLPFSERICEQLEAEYKSAVERQTWGNHFELPAEDPRGGYDRYVFNSPQSMIQYCAWSSSCHTLEDNDSSHGTTDAFMKLAEGGLNYYEERFVYVRRGLDQQLLEQLEEGESVPVNHVYFVVHGIGSIYNLRGQGLVECVNALRHTARRMVKEHQPETAGRPEFLPIMWHDTLHSDATGVDERLSRITLRSIPKLRQFTNGTLMDILFYTSSKYCQIVLDSVANDLQRLRAVFLKRNPEYQGGFSIIGHSLGAVVSFDLLAHQSPLHGISSPNELQLDEERSTQPCPTQASCDAVNSDVYGPHSRAELARILSEGGVDHQQIERLLSSYAADDSSSMANEIKLADCTRPICDSHKQSTQFSGFGVPKVVYPQLGFPIDALFMLGSPLGLFLTARGVHLLSPDYCLPTCSRFYNIFHPFDPVAYRMESLIDPDYRSPAALIPHHKGRKRLHLQFRDELARMGSGIKSKILESAQATWRTLQEFALSHRLYVQSVDSKGEYSENNEIADIISQIPKDHGDDDVEGSPGTLTHFKSRLNAGRRLDYVLQEAPLESFSDYLSALGSHATYWESEDTALFLITETLSDKPNRPSAHGIEHSAGDTSPMQLTQSSLLNENKVDFYRSEISSAFK